MMATVYVDGEAISGVVYHVRENGWPCVATETGRLASGPEDPSEETRSFNVMLADHGWGSA